MCFCVKHIFTKAVLLKRSHSSVWLLCVIYPILISIVSSYNRLKTDTFRAWWVICRIFNMCTCIWSFKCVYLYYIDGTSIYIVLFHNNSIREATKVVCSYHWSGAKSHAAVTHSQRCSFSLLKQGKLNSSDVQVGIFLSLLYPIGLCPGCPLCKPLWSLSWVAT